VRGTGTWVTMIVMYIGTAISRGWVFLFVV